jgi:uncharacterized protein (TIGR02246 family)
MKTREIALAALVASIVASGCAKKEEAPPPSAEPAAPAVDIAAEEAAIRNRSGEWMNFANAKDIASVVTVYSPDAITAYDGTVQRGQAEIQAGAERGLKENPNSVIAWSTTAVRVAASGDLAVETGNITVDPDGDAGKKPATTGVFVTAWEKVDGAWRVMADAGTENEKKAEAAN